MRFSQRIGKTAVKTLLQTESMDEALRNALWNAFDVFFAMRDKKNQFMDRGSSDAPFYRGLWHNFFKQPIDTLADYTPYNIKAVRDWFFKVDWFQVYDFLEYVAQDADDKAVAKQFCEFCNGILEREVAGYRFSGRKIVPVADMKDLRAIEEASSTAKEAGLSGVAIHLDSALEKLADRKSPDYRNSIKESISAIESLVRAVTGNPKAELGQALKAVEGKVGLHPALKKAFSALYGYTSDEGGIRHALMDEAKCDQADAKYMLVTCSAFVSYLVEKAIKAGLKL